MKLDNNMVVRVRGGIRRPSIWVSDGKMDEYVNKLVQVTQMSRYVICTPLFEPMFTTGWSFNAGDMVKANTVFETPKWAKDGVQNAIRLQTEAPQYDEDDEDDYDADREEEEEWERMEEERLQEEYEASLRDDRE